MTIGKYLYTYGAVFLFIVLTCSMYMLYTVNTSLEIKLPEDLSRRKLVQLKPLQDRLPANTYLGQIREFVFKNANHDETGSTLSTGQCVWWNVSEPTADVQMHTVYDYLPFDNPNGGAWKQGWQVTYPSNQWNSTNTLKVFVVPHSHTDPGWLMTYSEYYEGYVKNILYNMLEKLEQYPDGRFIYSQLAFFHIWWKELPRRDKDRVQRLVDDGRLEIVTGGWVMSDEATTHYFAMIDQLIEGHLWLNSSLHVNPAYGWSIDAFGHSPTMAYFLQLAGLEGIVIQRVHYAVKKYLAGTKQLEFLWRQSWDRDGRTHMLTHLMPYYMYDVPHTCGPDPSTCCEFDFVRKPLGSKACPWSSSRVRTITDDNVEERSMTLIDQWKKKAVMYRTNTVLVPLGDDFRYTTPEEWDQQFSNYLKIFNFTNQHPDLGVKAQFGTLSEYFSAVKSELIESTELSRVGSGLPTLSGDFFTYADRDDHYWSGYYTSRPLQKYLDRKLESHLRGAEVLFTLARTQAIRHGHFPVTDLMKQMVRARRNLALLQHHDGITGTARDTVVIDYTTRLLDSIEGLKVVLRECATYLTLDDKQLYDIDNPIYSLDERKDSVEFKFDKTVIDIIDGHVTQRPIMFYNSIAYHRMSVVSVLVNSPYVLIRDKVGQPIQSQIEPYWRTKDDISINIYQVTFEVSVSGLGIEMYTIQRVSANEEGRSVLVSVSTSDKDFATKRTAFNISELQGKQFVLENSYVKSLFDMETGLLQSVHSKGSGEWHKTELEYVTYGTRYHGDKSGAYLFLPDGPSKFLLNMEKPKVYVIQGPVRSTVRVNYDLVTFVATVTNTSGVEGQSVEIQNVVDIRPLNNFELALRISTDVNNTDRSFYTDLNGTMEVMLDRRLSQDDGKGLGQGILDNKVTTSRFRLLIETRESTIHTTKTISFPSVTAHQTSLDLAHPLFTVPPSSESEVNFPAQSSITPLQVDLPCDVHLLNLRTLHHEDDTEIYKPKDASTLILHKVGVDCSFPYHYCDNIHQKIKLSKLFDESYVRIESARETSLTMMHKRMVLDPEDNVDLSPMDIKALIVNTK